MENNRGCVNSVAYISCRKTPSLKDFRERSEHVPNSLCFDSAVNDLIPFDSSSVAATAAAVDDDVGRWRKERREIFETDNFQTQN